MYRIFALQLSSAHLKDYEMLNETQKKTFENITLRHNSAPIEKAIKYLNSVYYLAKTNCPFSYIEDFIPLQMINVVGVTLHSCNTAKETIKHISNEL